MASLWTVLIVVSIRVVWVQRQRAEWLLAVAVGNVVAWILGNLMLTLFGGF